MTLFVDRREDAKAYCGEPLTPYLRKWIVPRSDVDNSTELDSGDACHPINLPHGRVATAGYEIKHVSDALACMEDGRLAGVDGQLQKMQRDYAVRWVVIEDRIEPDENNGLLLKRISRVRLGGKRGGRRRKSTTTTHDTTRDGAWVAALYGGARQVLYSTLIKYLTIVCFEYGTMLWRTSNRDETAQFLAAQYDLWSKDYSLHKSIRTFNAAEQSKRPMLLPPDVKLRAKIMNCFEDLGFERSRAIARAYSVSPRKMFAAITEEEIAAVQWTSDKGKTMRVGKAAARALIEQIDSKVRR